MENFGTITIKTKRLILRKFQIADRKGVFEGYINQSEFLYYANKTHLSQSEVDLLIERIIDSYNDNTFNWVITLPSGEIVGSINVKEKDNNAIINYAIDNRFTGNGYMTEALEAVTEYLIKTNKFNKILAGCVSKNTASKRVLEKCGYKFVEIKFGYQKLADGQFDIMFFEKEKK